jgi:predicted AAA+ superfamily ATPase
MKNVYDNLNNIKIYASGSSSLSIKDQVQESLAGRKKVNEILPLDFEEFLSFKQKDILIKNLTNIKTLHGDNLDVSLKEYHQLLKEFLVFGGYPGVVLETARNKKMEALSSIFDLYVKKDLVEYINAEKILPIKTLIEFLAVNNGQKIKYDEITRVTSLNFKEIKRYIELLKETYIIELLRPFYTNKNKEIIKIPKIYFLDNGVRNFFIKNFNDLSLRNDAGFLFEGFVFSEFLKADKRDVNFWQDKNGNEVDLIIKKDEKIIPVEVKFKKQLKSEDLRGLESFSKEYIHSTECYLVNIGSQKRLKNINFVLPYSLSKIF